MFGDSAPEYKKACRKLKILHRAATPNSDDSNARHERFIGIFGDLIRNVLPQSGLPLMFWVYAAMFVANVYNMTVIAHKKSKRPYALRYPNRKLPKICHFGQLVTYVPKNMEKHSSRSRQGIFLGYAQHPGGVVTDEYVIIPLSCFTLGLKNINIVTSRDVRFTERPDFIIARWNESAKQRSYVETFKPLHGEDYYQHLWDKVARDPINQNPQGMSM